MTNLDVKVGFCVTKWRLLHFLKTLEATVPPPAGCHHAITFAQHGSDEVGWTDKLALQINHDRRFFCFFLDGDDDVLEHPTALIDEIVNVLREPGLPLQEGIGFGEYTVQYPDWRDCIGQG